MLGENVVFGFMAAAIAAAGLGVVTTKNVVHAALFLTVVLAGVAGLFALTAAEFATATQILVYIGAVVVLFLFGIMLTRAPTGKSHDLNNDQRLLAAGISLWFFGVLAYVVGHAYGSEKIQLKSVQRASSAADVIFTQYLVPFEILSMLLLAALVGAIVIARRD